MISLVGHNIMSLRFRIIKQDSMCENSLENTCESNDSMVIYYHIAMKIPLLRTLIETNDSNQIIEIDSMFKDLKSFIQHITDFLSKTKYNGRISELEKTLRSEYTNEQIYTYLQYLGLDKLFNKMYPLDNSLRKITTINELKTVFLKCEYISTNHDKKMYIFEDHVWKHMNTEQSILFIKSMITKHLPSMCNKMKQLVMTNSSCDTILNSLPGLLLFHRDPFFTVKLDNNKRYLGFDNGLYDLVKGKLIDGSSTHMVSRSVGHSYNARYMDKNKLMAFLKIIVQDDTMRDSLLFAVTKSLVDRTCFVFSCERNNNNDKPDDGYKTNKYAFIHLLKKTFGSEYSDQARDFRSNFRSNYSSNDSDNNGDSKLLNLLRKRFVVIDYQNCTNEYEIYHNEKNILDDNHISLEIPGFNLFETVDCDIIMNPIIDVKSKVNLNHCLKNDDNIKYFNFDQYVESCKQDFMLLLFDMLKDMQNL